MNTTITFHPHPVESTLDHLQAATSHPLHRQSFREECSDGSTEHLIVFGSEDVELARFIFLSDAAGQLTLVSVTGNLPVLLWGHDGRIIQDQVEYQTALTRLRWLGSPLVSEDDIDLLLPHVCESPQPERFLVAALPWSALWPLHLEVMKATLGGELGDGRLHDQLLESCPHDVLCDLLHPAREDAHEALFKSLGCPMGEDYEIDQTFCGHLFLERRDREQRVFFTLGSGLPH